jgi:ABC-type branched-subunit amino acid transport system ATPase component
VSADPLLSVEDLSIAFGGIRAVDGVSFSVQPNRITSLIGGNGAGKTTAFNLISGYLKPDKGTVTFRGQRVDGMRPHQIARLGMVRGFQELRLFSRLTSRDNVLAAIRDQRGEHILPALFGGRSLREEQRRNGEKADAILASLSIDAQADRLAENLSYGQQKLLSLGRLLANGGDLLLLDEPTSGINPRLVAEFCDRIRRLVDAGKTIFLIEHNVEVVMALSDWVIVMHQGQLIAEGPPEAVRRDHAVMHAYLGID